MNRYLLLPTLAFLAACTSMHVNSLKPGLDTAADVQRLVGEPAMRWQDSDGSVQLSYPGGSAGSTDSYMVRIGADGKVQSVENVLDSTHFAQIQAGMSKEQVLRILGPSIASETIYFERRNELAWTWYFRDYDDVARFNVLFDATKGTVRTTGVTPFRIIVSPSN